MATSVNRVLTGRGGNTLILDDPLKPDDALSFQCYLGAKMDWVRAPGMLPAAGDCNVP
jgi:hypothetical protein